MPNPNGRPIGSPNKQSLRLQTLVAERGDLSPGRVMLETMWFHYGEAARAQAGQEPDVDPKTKAGRKVIAEHMTAAHAAAKDVAPYVHTRLSAVIVQGDADGGPIRSLTGHVGVVGHVSLSPDELRKLDANELAQVYREAIAASGVLDEESETDPARAGDVQP